MMTTAANVGDESQLVRLQNTGIEYALTSAQGRWFFVENYSKEQLASYIQTEWGYDTPLLSRF